MAHKIFVLDTNFFLHDAESIFSFQDNEQQSAIGRLAADGDRIVPLYDLPREGIWEILPRNREQKLALDLLMHPQSHLTTLVGKAGTGKPLLAIAAGLQSITENQQYSRLLVSRPVFPMGRDLGSAGRCR